MQFTDHGIEGVVPLELLPPEVRSKYQAKTSDRSKRAKKEEAKGPANQAEENQVSISFFRFRLNFNVKGSLSQEFVIWKSLEPIINSNHWLKL